MAKIYVSMYAPPAIGQQVSTCLSGCPDFEIVEITTSLDLLETAILKHKSQVLLLHAPRDPSGLLDLSDIVTMLNYMQARHFDVKSLVLAHRLDIDHVKESIEAGALGYVKLDSCFDGLIPAIRLVHTGKMALAPEIIPFLV
jgi:DNA-binding NarL/FixJ family response regulator